MLLRSPCLSRFRRAWSQQSLLSLRWLGSKQPEPPTQAVLKFGSENVKSLSQKAANVHKGSKGLGGSGSQAAALSPSVLSSMLDEALLQRDGDTLSLLVDQALMVRNISILEKCLTFSLEKNVFDVGAEVLKHCGVHHLVLSESLTQAFTQKCVEHALWTPAYHAIGYTIRHNQALSENLLFFVLGGLMAENDTGVLKALRLVKLIVRHQREDLAKFVSISKVNRLTVSFGGVKRMGKLDLSKYVSQVMEMMLAQYDKSGWISFSVAKFIASVASAAREDELVTNFARQLLQRVGSRKDMPMESDVLSLLRAFSQGEAVVSRKKGWKGIDIRKQHTSLSALLLESKFKYASAYGANARGILRTFNFYTSYWTLAYRMRGADLSEASKHDPFHSARIHYNSLMEFFHDSTKDTLELSNIIPAERKVMRNLCDSLQLHHKVAFLRDGSCNLVVTKVDPMLPVRPPPFDSLLAQDLNIDAAFKVFDGEPHFWPAVKDLLRQLDDEALHKLVHKLSHTVKIYPSVSWMLLLVQELQLRQHPLPYGTLQSMLRMATSRVDLYGVLEVMHVAMREKELCKTSVYQSKLRALRSMRRLVVPSDWDIEDQDVTADDSHDSYDDSTTTVAVGDSLYSKDWSGACVQVFIKRPLMHLPKAIYKDAFLELLGLMRRYGVEMDAPALRILMRFLRQSMHNSQHLPVLLQRVFTDTNYVLDQDECAVLALQLIDKFNLGDLFSPSPLQFTLGSYLALQPGCRDAVLRELLKAIAYDEDMDEVRRTKELFEKSVDSEGRLELAKLLHQRLQILSEVPKSNSRRSRVDLFAPSIVYTSYLLSHYDGQHRLSYELMYKVLELV
eukprot:gene8266-9115_t